MRTDSWKKLGLFVLLSTVVTGCGAPENPGATLADFYIRQMLGSDLPKGTFALTFDDGPSERTVELAQFLNENGVRATFFVQGSQAEANIDAVRATKGYGHIIANHSYSHPRMTKSADPVGEVSRTDALIAPFIDNGIFLFRAPYGDWSSALPTILNGSPMKKYVGSVFWDIGGEYADGFAADWACWNRGVAVETCGDMYLDEMEYRGRGIVLSHDIHGRTVDMMKYVVPIMMERGYKFVGVDEVPNIAAKLKQH